MHRRALLASALIVSCFSAAHAQRLAVFEAASIRPDDSGQPGGMRLLPTGQFTGTAITVHELILRAYGLHESQVFGAPDWTRSERYSIVARSDAPPSGGTAGLIPMLRGLLVDRFGLRTRTERRTLSAFVVTRLRPDRLGPGIRASTIDCAANPPSPVPDTMSLSADGWPPCGLTLMRTIVGDIGQRIEMIQSATTIGEFGFRLQSILGGPVVDRTPLAGVFDIRFVFGRQTATNPGGVAATPSDARDLYGALEEELGLKLESDRTEVPVLVIDSVERPTAN